MNNKYDIVLLLGGTGSRMPDKPSNKHLVTIGNKTMVERAKDKVEELGDIVDIETKHAIVNDFGVVEIMKILGSDWKYHYQDRPTGIIDAAKIAKPKNPFLLYLGDQFYGNHLGRLAAGFAESNEMVRIWIKDSNQAKYHTTMFTRENMIYNFKEKPNVKKGWVTTGLYMMKPNIFKYSNNLPRNIKGENNLADLLNETLKHGETIGARPMTKYWIDVGTPQKVMEAEKQIGHQRYKFNPP